MRLRRRQRITLLLLVLLCSAGATALALTALNDKIAFFVSPSDIATGNLPDGKRFRLGGLVVEGSVERRADGEIDFGLTDGAHSVVVAYTGILPDLFREGQGIVAQGSLDGSGRFVAKEVLAKHDERYMPPEVTSALKRSGHWQPDGSAQPRMTAR